jgi:NAD(P) transhydrogenase subunit beta
MAIGDPLLVAVGGIVGASGLLLTQIMCRAMNRSLQDILTGRTTMSAAPGDKTLSAAAPLANGAAEKKELDIGAILREAKRVIIIPGYGMAVAQAQETVKELADKLERRGATVDYAIHPVAGRMPGHMNVLLAEVDVPYDKLREMDDINPEFENCDVAIIVGANDVVNPAAREAQGTPIYGMPVLAADNAKHIIICNRSNRPGYAGVINPLYASPNAQVFLGNAAESVRKVIGFLEES